MENLTSQKIQPWTRKDAVLNVVVYVLNFILLGLMFLGAIYLGSGSSHREIFCFALKSQTAGSRTIHRKIHCLDIERHDGTARDRHIKQSTLDNILKLSLCMTNFHITQSVVVDGNIGHGRTL